MILEARLPPLSNIKYPYPVSRIMNGSLEPRLSGMLFFSLIVHAVMLSIIYHFAKTPERFFITPVYTVDLVSMPDIERGLSDKKRVVKVEKRSKKEGEHKIAKTAKKEGVSKKQVRKKASESPVKKPIIEQAKLFAPSKKEGGAAKRELTEDKPVKESPKQTVKLKDSVEKIEPEKTVSLETIKETLKKQQEMIKEAFTEMGKENASEKRLEDILPLKGGEEKKEGLERIEAPKKTVKAIDTLGDKDILKETEEIKEEFEKLKGKEATRVEAIKKEISKGGKEIDIPSYKPIEWKVNLKDTKGTLAVGSKEGKVDNRLLDVEFKAYYREIGERVHSSWILPENIPDDSVRRAVIVSISIKRGGEILTIKTESSSGNNPFDRSAIRAIEKANPLPPLPEGYSGDILEVGLRFCPPWWDSCE